MFISKQFFNTILSFKYHIYNVFLCAYTFLHCKNTHFFNNQSSIKKFPAESLPPRIFFTLRAHFSHYAQRTHSAVRLHIFYFSTSFFSLSVSIGTILWRSPTMPRSAAVKIGAYLSLLMAMMKSDSSIPARCWIAPEIPHAM